MWGAIGRPISVTKAGFKIAGRDPVVERAPPSLGEHTDEVLAGLGYSETQIADFRADGVL